MQPSAPLRVRHNNIAIDQRVGRRAAEAIVQTGLLHLKLTLRVYASSSPRRLQHFRRGSVASSTADPSVDVPQGVVPADDQAPNAASECVKTVGVQRLGTLTSSGCRNCFLCRITAPLVSALSPLIPEAQRDTKAETRANSELQIGETRGRRRRRRQKPRSSTRTPTTTKPSTSRWSQR